MTLAEVYNETQSVKWHFLRKITTNSQSDNGFLITKNNKGGFNFYFSTDTNGRQFQCTNFLIICKGKTTTSSGEN
jgi:hypothetical protein